MKSPQLLRCIALLAAIFLSSPAHSQTVSTKYIKSGPATTMTAPAGTFGFELPLERAGHAFSFKWRVTTGAVTKSGTTTVKGFVTTSGTGATAVLRSYLITTPIPSAFSSVEWWLTDTTANQESTHYTGAAVSKDLRATTWSQISGVPSTFFAISDAHIGHLLMAGSTQVGWSLLTPSYLIGTYSAGSTGSLVPMHWFIGSAAVGAGNFSVADRTDGSKASLNQTNIVNASWTYDFPVVPLASVKFYLPAAEANNLYVLHYQIPEQVGSALTLWPTKVDVALSTATVNAGVQSVSVGDSTVAALVAIGADFWLTRNIDGYTTPIFSLPSVLANSSAPKVWSVAIPPAVVDWVPVTFGIASGRAGQTFSVLQQSSISSAVLTGPTLTIQDYTAEGYDHHFDYFTVTAMVNSAEHFNLRTLTASGEQLFSQDQVWVLDGWTQIGGQALAASPGAPPPPPSGPFTLSLTVTGPRTFSPFFKFIAPDGTVITSLDSLSLAPVSLPDYRLGGNATWTSQYAAITILVPSAINPVGRWTVIDQAINDPIPLSLMVGNPASHSETLYWAPPEKNRVFQISQSRWSADPDPAPRLWVEQADGWRAPLTNAGSLGSFSILNNHVWTDSYYTFAANGKVRDNVPFWVFDEETGERSPPTSGVDLITWFAIPTPSGLTGSINASTETAELQWPKGLSAPEGGFDIERQLTGESAWQKIGARAADADVIHFTDPNLVVGKVHTYRVRYTYGSGAGARRSARSNLVILPDWRDLDGDGLPDAWEMAYLGSLGFDGSGVESDPDGDGQSNAYEFAHHTNPNALPAGAPGGTLIVYTPLQ